MTGPRTEVIRRHILQRAASSAVHGAGLAEDFAHHGVHISPGTLYPALHRLEAEGLLSARNHVVNGRARRVYLATDAGRAALAELLPLPEHSA